MFIEVRGSFVGIPSNQHRASISLASVSPSCLTTQQTSDRSLKSARLRVKFTEQNGADHDAVEAAHAPGIRLGHHDGIACGVCALAARSRLHLRAVPQPDPLEESMRPLLAVSLFALACTLAIPAMAQNKEVGVPILKAPYHLPVFTNEYVTVLKIFIPPGRNTGSHTHTEDSVSVNIVPADMTNQNLGSSEVTRGERAQRGRAGYTSYSKQGPRTHKATNIGETP